MLPQPLLLLLLLLLLLGGVRVMIGTTATAAAATAESRVGSANQKMWQRESGAGEEVVLFSLLHCLNHTQNDVVVIEPMMEGV
jgi:hypothetical protein